MQMGVEAEQLHASLRQKIVGQDDAIAPIIEIYQTYLAGMSHPGRPIGNLLFLGPTGTGKTRLVEATAESLTGDAQAVIKIDCAEFQHSHEIAKLIGSPPGYLGHRETRPALSQQALNQYHTDSVKVSFLLFDEIEKASEALWNLMLGILDKATLTLGDNSKVDFSSTIIFMTSNLGAAEMESLLRPKMGFAASEVERQNQTGRMEPAMLGKISGIGLAAARSKFTPEFMNRIDKVLVFRPLGDAELRRILEIELRLLQKRIQNVRPDRLFAFTLTEPAKDHLLREGTNVKYGARELKRTVERMLVHPLSNLLTSDQVRLGDVVRVDYSSELKRMVFAKEETIAVGGRRIRPMADDRQKATPDNYANSDAASNCLKGEMT
jgi:ATP-dependent Clp protease ATP-binding subunit ClpA